MKIKLPRLLINSFESSSSESIFILTRSNNLEFSNILSPSSQFMSNFAVSSFTDCITHLLFPKSLLWLSLNTEILNLFLRVWFLWIKAFLNPPEPNISNEFSPTSFERWNTSLVILQKFVSFSICFFFLK